MWKEKKKKERLEEEKQKCQQRQSREGASSQPGSHTAIPCPHDVDILFRARINHLRTHITP